MKKLIRYLVVSLCAALVASCGDEDQKQPKAETSTSVFIGNGEKAIEPEPDIPEANSAEQPNTLESTLQAAEEKPQNNQNVASNPEAIESVKGEQLSEEKQGLDHAHFAVSVIRESLYDGGSTVEIRFTLPLDTRKNYSEYVQVSPVQDTGWVLSADGRSLFMLGAQPDTEYGVRVSPDILSENGKTLLRTEYKSVKTAGAPAILSFAGDGHVLPINGHRGLPVVTQNVPEANVSFFRLYDDQIHSLGSAFYSGSELSSSQLDRLTEGMELVYEGRFALTTDVNRRRQVNLPIGSIEALNKPGVYVAVMSAPGRFPYRRPATWYSVSDLGLHLRNYAQGAELFVQSLNTTAAVTNAQLELVRSNGSSKPLGFTDGEGRFSFSSPLRSTETLVVRKDSSVSVLQLSTTALDLSDYRFSQRPQSNQNLFIYGPRDLYRGGETAQFSALLRDEDGQLVKSPTLKAKVIRPDGQVAKTLTLKPLSSGYYEWQYKIAAEAKTGDWRIDIRLADKTHAIYRFKVEDFMPERMKMTWHPGVDHDQANIHSGRGDLEVSVLGEYLYGAPANGNRFDAKISIKAEPHPFIQWPEYWFGNASMDRWNGKAEQSVIMDEDGLAKLTLKNQWSAARIPVAATITGSLFESGGRPVVRRQKEVWLPAKQLLGVKPAFKDNAPENALADFEAIFTDGSAELLSRERVKATLVNVTPRHHWSYHSARGWYREREEQAVQELSFSVSVQPGQPTRFQVPVGRGEYHLILEDSETGLQSVLPFEAGDGHYWWHYRDDDRAIQPNKISLAWDKSGYREGDVALLEVTPPSAIEALAGESYEALVMVEGEDLKFFKRVALPRAGGMVEIPIGADWNQHNLYASVLYLQPSDTQERVTPTRSIGLIHLPINRSDRELNIQLNAPEKWLPGRTVDVNLDITDNQGKPVNQAWVTVAAVDVGVLSIARFQTPQPFQFFYEPKRYEADQYDLYHQVIDFNDSKPAQVRFGGDASMARGGDMARSQVQIVSLYTGRVQVSQGKVTVPLELPEFNGRIRLMAVAFNDNQFGQADAEVTVAAPVVAQMSLPRFAGIGDDSVIGLDVTNLSGSETVLVVRTEASGDVVFEPNKQEIALAHKQKTTLVFPFRATEPEYGSLGYIGFRVIIDGFEEYPIDRQWELISRPTLAAVSYQYRNRLSSGELLKFDAKELDGLQQQGLKGELTLDSKVNLNPAKQLDRLLRYPYGCLEQSVSSTYPWLLVDQQQIDALNEHRKNPFVREDALERGLGLIYQRQLDSGGFGLWSRSDKYEQHWLTAYAVDFMIEAEAQGYSVDKNVLSDAMKRLQQYVRGRATARERWNESTDAYRFAYRAYAAYSLARRTQMSIDNIRKLADKTPSDATSLALVQLSAAASIMGDTAKSHELLEQAKAVERVLGYLGDYGSGIRDKAAIIHILGKHNLDAAWKDDLLYSLESDLKQRRWLSTQERIQLLKASSLEGTEPQAWQASVQFVQASTSNSSFEVAGDYQKRLPLTAQEVLAVPLVSNTGDHSFSAELSIQGYQKNTAPINQKDVSIIRTYFDTDGQKITLDDDQLQLRVGDRILVQLEVDSDQYRPDLLAVDLLPAGLELENANLDPSDPETVNDDFELVIDQASLNEWNDSSGIVHKEFRDDRFVAALETGGHRRNARIFYYARAVTPGRYQIPGPLLEDMYDPEARSLGISTRTLVIEP